MSYSDTKHELQLFINHWCLKLNVPFVRLNLVSQQEMDKEENNDQEDIIYLLDTAIKDIDYCKKVLLHEVVHLALYYNFLHPVYKNETVVQEITEEIYTRYYLNAE